jgi:hypothetical protein
MAIAAAARRALGCAAACRLMSETVEMIGGPLDGQVFDVPVLLPLLVLPLPPEQQNRLGIASFVGLLAPYPVALELRTVRYRCTSISDATHRWVYVPDE